MTRIPLSVRGIEPAAHLAYLRDQYGASYQQTPAWGHLRPGWRPQSVGWFDGSRLRGVGLVMYRDLPVLPASFAYLPEGPVLDWTCDTADLARPLVEYLRTRRVATVKIGPSLVLRRWGAATVRAAVRDGGGARRLCDLPPDSVDATALAATERLRSLGWRRYEAGGPGFGGTLQPRYRWHVPCAGRSADALRGGLDASWRRNLRRAERSGVRVREGSVADLPVFHRMYVETAERDGFAARPLSIFQRMWQVAKAEDEGRIRLYLAEADGEPHAAALRTGLADVASYTYGASTTAGRDLRPSNAMQWRMLTDAAAGGAAVYDLRGISDTLDPADPLFGLLRFKLGLGGEAVELVGEWDYPLRPLLHRALTAYLDRRPH